MTDFIGMLMVSVILILWVRGVLMSDGSDRNGD